MGTLWLGANLGGPSVRGRPLSTSDSKSSILHAHAIGSEAHSLQQWIRRSPQVTTGSRRSPLGTLNSQDLQAVTFPFFRHDLHWKGHLSDGLSQKGISWRANHTPGGDEPIGRARRGGRNCPATPRPQNRRPLAACSHLRRPFYRAAALMALEAVLVAGPQDGHMACGAVTPQYVPCSFWPSIRLEATNIAREPLAGELFIGLRPSWPTGGLTTSRLEVPKSVSPGRGSGGDTRATGVSPLGG
eukprot:gene7780-biopygen21080